MSAKVVRVPVPSPTLRPFTTTNCYLIGNRQESLLIDAGYDQPETRTVIEQALKENDLAMPRSILLTHAHPDHAPGVRRFAELSPVVYCHPLEERAVLKAVSPWSALTLLNDGDVLQIAGLELEVLHTPGHTAGHLGVYLPSERILLAGDNIVAEGTTWIGKPDGDMAEYIRTLQRLKGLALTRIGPGHGGWVDTPYEQIDFVIRRRLEREQQIHSLLQSHQRLTAERLTELIYGDTIHPSVFEVAKRTTEAHLVKLQQEGAARQEGESWAV